jgi:hypothetical protein
VGYEIGAMNARRWRPPDTMVESFVTARRDDEKRCPPRGLTRWSGCKWNTGMHLSAAGVASRQEIRNMAAGAARSSPDF